MRIAVCDDEEIYREELRKCIAGYCDDRKIDLEVDEYKDGNELLASQKKYDMVFLDIEMGLMDGLTVAEGIRAYDMNVPIVYVTSHTKYALRAYKVHPFGFLQKPIKLSDIQCLLDDYMRLLKENEGKKIMLITTEGAVNIPMNEIYYFLINTHREVEIKTITKEYRIKEKLVNLYNMLDKEQFYMTHRCCIVNLRYVKSLENNYDIIMINGDFCPLAQKKKSEFMNLLAKNALSRLKGDSL